MSRKSKIENGELLTLDNPRYSDLLNNHPYLRGVAMEISDTKAHLPAHLIIGANDFPRYGPVIVCGSDVEEKHNTKPNSLSVGDVVII